MTRAVLSILVIGLSILAFSDIAIGKSDIAAVDIKFRHKGWGEADLSIIVENRGDEFIKSLSYTFKINKIEEGGKIPFYLQPGERREFDFSHAFENYYNYFTIPPDGELKMEFVIDTEDKLKETDEKNNKVTRTYKIELGEKGGHP